MSSTKARARERILKQEEDRRLEEKALALRKARVGSGVDVLAHVMQQWSHVLVETALIAWVESFGEVIC